MRMEMMKGVTGICPGEVPLWGWALEAPLYREGFVVCGCDLILLISKMAGCGMHGRQDIVGNMNIIKP